MKTIRTILFAACLAVLLPWASIGEAVERDVPYVPTPEEVVDEMLRMAEVGEGDVVYDLGCGDGRIVVSAALERGARGVGVDIDPDRIRESNARAQAAQVTDRVQFLQQNLFDVDLREASVVTLYLLQSVNLRLRPKLFAELKPGTRVVSHDFHMGNWEPDEVSRLERSTVYFWRVPANATGTWEWTRSGPAGEEHCRLELVQDFQVVSGRLTEGAATMPIRDGRVNGDKLRFTVDRQENGRQVPVSFEGQLREDILQGHQRAAGATGGRKWQAQRDPATRVPLDE